MNNLLGTNAIFAPSPSVGGKYVVRLLGGSPFNTAKRVHRFSDHINGPTKKIGCAKTLMDGRWVGTCLICDYLNDFYQNGPPKFFTGSQEEFESKLRTMKPMERFYYNAIDRADEAFGPKIYSIGKFLHHKILTAIIGDFNLNEAPLGDVTHPTQGRDFSVKTHFPTHSNGMHIPMYESKFLAESRLGTDEQVKRWYESKHDLKDFSITAFEDGNKREILNLMESVFGSLSVQKGKKSVHRSIMAPFEPEW